MTKCITLENPDGTVATRGGVSAERLARQFGGDVDAALAYILAELVPVQNPGATGRIEDVTFPVDRLFRGAWRRGAGAIVEDADECRVIRSAQYATAKLTTLRGLRDREDLGENVDAERTTVRAVDPDAECAGKSPDQLRAHWPGAIERREGGR